MGTTIVQALKPLKMAFQFMGVVDRLRCVIAVIQWRIKDFVASILHITSKYCALCEI